MSQPAKDHGPEYRHVDDMAWETLRFPGQESKMLFHPRPERSSEPNTGFVRYEPGAYHPRHRHDFAQVWHILEGTFKIGERTVGPGTVVFYADPHYEEDLSTETGGLMFFVQYTGAGHGQGPDLRRPLQHAGAQVALRGEPAGLEDAAGLRPLIRVASPNSGSRRRGRRSNGGYSDAAPMTSRGCGDPRRSRPSAR